MQPRRAPSAANDDDLLAEGVEEIIAEHGGDARGAIRALLETVSYLEKARPSVGFGFLRLRTGQAQ